ncbi:hypothetical protein HOY82DRAFT_548269 [Tuber indicum]|nr:hypothetical protein HOY82DRAFT_548269 [Tuber indicum]
MLTSCLGFSLRVVFCFLRPEVGRMGAVGSFHERAKEVYEYDRKSLLGLKYEYSYFTLSHAEELDTVRINPIYATRSTRTKQHQSRRQQIFLTVLEYLYCNLTLTLNSKLACAS